MSVEDFYNDFYFKAINSIAHSKMCKKVYGMNLCQHGMSDQKQINNMIKLLGINNESKVLDLGCGPGLITKYIQEKTNCTILGIDISETAITLAKDASTRNKKINFKRHDIQNIDELPNDFDAILSIDSHYFIDNFLDKIGMYLSHLSNNGMFAVFSDEGTENVEIDEKNLKIKDTIIGKYLDDNRIEYIGLELYQANKNHWNKKKKILMKLKKEFIKENNQDIYNNRMQECINECRNKSGRYLYIIKKDACA